MTPLAGERSGPAGDAPVLLLHAGVCDRRMWDPVWPELATRRDAVRVDLRGFGDTPGRPDGPLCHAEDVHDVVTALGVESAHVVGASMGAGVAVELALERPELVASLLLIAPGGSLIPQLTPQLRAFVDAEDAALDAGDLDAAVAANLATWVDGPGQSSDRVDPGVRAAVGQMQRRAFELTRDWDDVEERELDPLRRLPEVGARTLVLSGGLDVDAIAAAAEAVLAGVPDVRHETWPDVAHLPSLERPQEFLALLLGWLA